MTVEGLNFATELANLFNRNDFPEEAFYIHRKFKGKKIIVYGTGEAYHYFKEIVTRQYGYMPSVVLDRKYSAGDIFDGVPAFAPHEYQPSAEECRNTVVVVCLGRQTYFQEVVVTLQEMGFTSIISLMDIYEIHNPFRLPEELESNGFQYYLQQREAIQACLDILEDDLSKEVYLRTMQTHMQRRPVPIPMCPRDEQYTPRDVHLSQGYSRFLYCGVSVGEMAHIFKTIGKVATAVFFEPDPNQFSHASEWLSHHHQQVAEQIMLLPCAVYSHESVAPFVYSDTSFGSRLLPSGSTCVQTVAIDHILPGFRPTIITMDIEGAELHALKGAEKTIRDSRPDLAICVYHAPHHLWSVPLHIHQLGLGYRFYLRNYTSLTGETVLYAVQ